MANHGDSKRVKKQMSWMKKYLQDKTIKEEAKADKASHQLGQSLVHRVKVMESRVKAMMEKPLPPGFNTLGLAFNLFTGEPGEKMVDVATDSVHKSDSTLLYQKYKCPAGVYGDVISDEEESRTVQVFQDETSFAYTLASEMKDGKILKGALALAPEIESVRPIFAGNSYLARIRKSINQFRLGIAAGASTDNGLRHDLVPGNPAKAEFGSDKSLAQKMDDDDSSQSIQAPGEGNKAYTINEDFLHNVCDLKGVGRGGVDWLPDCVFSPKSIVLDKDFQDENSQNIFRSRNKHERANAEKESDEVRICSATDTVKVSNFIKYYGTDYIQEVTLGGEAIQTFEIRGAAVDSENTQPEAIISTIINKYEEHFEGKDKAVDGHYNLKDPMLAAAVDGYMNKKIQKSLNKDALLLTMKRNKREEVERAAEQIEKGESPNPKVADAKEASDVLDGNDVSKSETKTQRRKLLGEPSTSKMKEEYRKIRTNGLSNPPDPKRVQSFMHRLGIQNVHMSYTGGGRYPIGVRDLEGDDLSVWAKSVEENPEVTAIRLKPITELLMEEETITRCTLERDLMKIIYKGKHKHKFKKLINACDDGSENSCSEYEKMVEQEKQNLMKTKWNREKLTQEHLPDTKFGRVLMRKHLALMNYIRYFKVKAHKYQQLAMETETEKAQLEMHLNRLKMTLSHFGKGIVKLDKKAYMTMVNKPGLHLMWEYLVKKTNLAGADQALNLVGPIVAYGTEVFETRHRAAKYCAMKAEVFQRSWALNGNTNIQTTKQLEKENVEKSLPSKSKGDGRNIPADTIATFPALEQASPQDEMRARSVEKQCMDVWEHKLGNYKDTFYAEDTDFGSDVKSLFFASRDLSCLQCASAVYNELDPQREFTQSKESGENGVQSSVLAFCYSRKSSFEQLLCKMTVRNVRDTIGNGHGFALNDILNPKKQLSYFLSKLFLNNPKFRQFAKPINADTGKEWNKLEIANAVCGVYLGCPATVQRDYDDYMSTNSGYESVKASISAKKAEKQLENELSKSEGQRDQSVLDKAMKNTEAAQKVQKCSDFRTSYRTYMSMKERVRASKNMKRCYVCSKFILLNKLLYADQGGNIKGESSSLYPKTFLKYPDAKRKSCDGDMFNDGKDSLVEAEGKCGGSIYQLLIGKKKDMEATGGTKKNAFLQLFSTMRSKNYLGTPVTDMLSGSAGTGKEGASKKALEEKIRSQAVKDGKQQLDCGIARIIPSKLKEIKDRVECMKVKTGGNLQGSLSKGKCAKIVKSVEKKVSMKLNYLASAIGMPVPKNVPFPKKVQMYESFKDQAIDTQGSPTSSVIDFDALGLAGHLDTKNICVDLKYCNAEDAEYVRGYFSREAAQNYQFSGKMKRGKMDGTIKDAGQDDIPLFRPGFGELGQKELDSMNAKSKKLHGAIFGKGKKQ
eukprot:g597.t1